MNIKEKRAKIRKLLKPFGITACAAEYRLYGGIHKAVRLTFPKNWKTEVVYVPHLERWKARPKAPEGDISALVEAGIVLKCPKENKYYMDKHLFLSDVNF